jgi:hypothetical protein
VPHHDAGQEEHELQEHATPAGQVRSGQGSIRRRGARGARGGCTAVEDRSQLCSVL